MFSFKNLSGLSQMMMNAGSIAERVKAIRSDLANEVATGTAAEGSIEVEVTGAGEVKRLTICSTLIQHGNTDLLEQQLPVALNQALAKIKEMHLAKLRELTGGMDLPGINEILGS